MHDDDRPPEEDEVFASVTITLDKSNSQTHTHSDGSEHQLYACVLAIENHGFPNEKFVEALLMAASSTIAMFFKEDVIKESVPEQFREEMATVLARKFLQNKVEEGDWPSSGVALAIPGSMPVSEG